MKKLLVAVVVCCSLVLGSCTDSFVGKIKGLGSEFKIELLNANGSVCRTWISTGKVQSEEGSDGYYFVDKKTGKLIEVRGTLVISSKK